MFKTTLKRGFLIITALAVLSGCYGKSAVTDTVNIFSPETALSTGVWQMAIIAEATTNFSSLIYDKTEAKFDSFAVHPIKMLPTNGKFYIMPAVYTDYYGAKTYDDAYAGIVSNYLIFNGFGSTVKNIEEADYVLIVDVKESPEKMSGRNTSSISISIMELDETPVFYAKTDVYSKSDSNFYYKPSKRAKPVKYLTLKGMERIFEEGLPKAFIG